ncbi:unnamed protein product [Orchesella dallaii]|uniref:CUB domain-containing protein n=1 Tax=Orchesella dallaii TaxID=48710 RepID=A0ABP1S8D3_9HEXA
MNRYYRSLSLYLIKADFLFKCSIYVKVLSNLTPAHLNSRDIKASLIHIIFIVQSFPLKLKVIKQLAAKHLKMNNFIFISLAILGTFSVSILARPDIIKDSSPQYLSCGGELNETYGTIVYKTDVSVFQNERCVWTIRNANAVSYSLDVLTYGLQPVAGDIGIEATCISKVGSRDVTISRTSIVQQGVVNLGSPCHLLLITYYSGENIQNSRGFAMLYTAVTGSSGISADSRHHMVNTVQGHVRHPLDVEMTYTSNEISTFTFAPLDNIHNPETKTVVSFVEDGLEAGCYDYLMLFQFSPATGWSSDHSLCSGTGYEKWESDDMIMAVFITDGSNVGRGFHLVHSHELTTLAKKD